MQTPQAAAIDKYISTGAHDPDDGTWAGDNFLARLSTAKAALRNALIETVCTRTRDAKLPATLPAIDPTSLSRAKVAPLVRGLLPRKEQEIVLDALTQSIVFLTPENIEAILRGQAWLGTAWNLANIYLESCGAVPLSAQPCGLVGLSEGTNCFVSMKYFEAEYRLDDFIVHEAAHVFHNCKRMTIGLPQSSRHEWLLDIEFSKRETFAYACERYSRILEVGRSVASRCALLHDIDSLVVPDDRVDANEYIDILRGAVAARNGWKYILHRCSPPSVRMDR